jgi:hypothetical protein
VNPITGFFVRRRRMAAVARAFTASFISIPAASALIAFTAADVIADEVRDLDAFITAGMDDWSLTGLAVVVVDADRTAFLRGYGVRDITTMEPVDDNTGVGLHESVLYYRMPATRNELLGRLPDVKRRLAEEQDWWLTFRVDEGAVATLQIESAHDVEGTFTRVPHD